MRAKGVHEPILLENESRCKNRESRGSSTSHEEKEKKEFRKEWKVRDKVKQREQNRQIVGVLLGRGERTGGGEVVYMHPRAPLQEKNRKRERLVKADLEKNQSCLTQCKI